jgi:2-polyprenyl-3-methyl-5-hydroxy-6-metoxy-1,4-benzoquinol methylase
VELWPAFSDGRRYRHCAGCDLRFLDPAQRLSAAEERARYVLHTASVEDEGYRAFVTPLLERVRRHIAPGSRGLDFGAGRVPVLAEWLRREGFAMSVHDAFFHPNESALSGEPYDFIVACEVIEHLFAPAAELRRLADCLKSGGRLFVQTDIYRGDCDFASWYYRRDPSHVAFYSERSFTWMAAAFGFTPALEVEGRVVSLVKG